MIDTARLTAYDAPKLRMKLVPVSIKVESPTPGLAREWNGKVHRWHRRAGR